MVKGAAKPAAGAAGGSTPSAQPLPQMGTGLNMGSNPLDNLERHHVSLGGITGS
jgi:ubiquilin